MTYASLLPLTSDCEDEVDTSTQSDVYFDYNIRCITHGMMDDKLVFSAISPLRAYIDSQKSNLQLSVINKYVLQVLKRISIEFIVLAHLYQQP